MRSWIPAFLTLALPVAVAAQTAPFSIHLEPATVPGLGGLQSYAWASHEGKWLILGGRTDGLHWRQPFASFDAAGNNRNLLVVDPSAGQVWAAPLSALGVTYQDQLSSTNMQFHQQGDRLYLVGGYGYSQSGADPYTYDFITAVDVPQVVDAVVNGTSITPYFRQASDPRLAVTGGHLKHIGDTYYLVGGQRFDGRYNPMGPTHGPGFFQEYTNAIRRFHLADDGTTLTLSFLPEWKDTNHLHRRDYNVVAQVMPDGSLGGTAFSGVFQKTVDWPYLNCVNFDSTGYALNDSFAQHYNHYHCANLPLYSASRNEMHTVFFGGIAQFYDDAGVLVQDNDVPFVRTIARVTRTADGLMTEHKLPVEMPSLLGASSEFIPVEGLPVHENGVIRLDSLTADTTLVGYVYGGIASTAPNIFFINDGTQSSASPQLFKVHVVKGSGVGVDDPNEASNATLRLRVDPNPNDGNFYTRFELTKAATVHVTITTVEGRKVAQETLDLPAGAHKYHKHWRGLAKGGVYLITVDAGYERAVQRVVVNL